MREYTREPSSSPPRTFLVIFPKLSHKHPRLPPSSARGGRGGRLPLRVALRLHAPRIVGGGGAEAARALALKPDGLGWKVSLLPAPDGQDWNDVLNEKGVVT